MRNALVAVAMVVSITIVTGSAAVATHSSWFPDDGCAPGLGSNGYFYAGGPAAYWTVAAGGWNNCHMETYTSSSLVNYAEWYLPISTQYDGYYSLQAYVSNAGPPPYTTEAIYYMWANGHSGGVTQVQVLDQRANQGGFCYTFGPNLLMHGSNGGLSEILDSNTKQDGYIYVDLFCFRVP